jgi:hypothetical protein
MLSPGEISRNVGVEGFPFLCGYAGSLRTRRCDSKRRSARLVQPRYPKVHANFSRLWRGLEQTAFKVKRV